MKSYIIKFQGHQYQVSPNDKLLVDRIEGNVDDVVEIKEVLLVNDGKSIQIGKPLVEGFIVKAKILAQKKADKIEIVRYKKKNRYLKRMGFREQETEILILE